MTATILVPILVAIIGALVYALSANPKLQQLGLYAFGAGMIAICFYYAGHPVRIP